jgi:hypothetical protein
LFFVFCFFVLYPIAAETLTHLGDYVRIELSKIPAEFIKFFNPTSPVVIGGLAINEDAVGYVGVR